MKLVGFQVPVGKLVQPGDCLLYKSGGLIGWIIKVKTWHAISHCESYIGGGRSVASRGPQDGKGGVGTWTLRTEGLAHIMRLREGFNCQNALAWFATVSGEKYDVWGLFRFFTIGRGAQDRMFCSEFLTSWYRAGGLEQFQPDEDADLIAPCQFLISPVFDHYTVTEQGGDLVVSPAGVVVDVVVQEGK